MKRRASTDWTACGTVMNELEYFNYSGRRKDAEIWRCCWRRRIVRRMSKMD